MTREIDLGAAREARRVLVALFLTALLAAPVAARAASSAGPASFELAGAAGPLYFDGLRVASDFRPASAPPPRPSGFRERDLALLSYDTPLRIGASDLLFKLRAPGSKRSIFTLELRF